MSSIDHAPPGSRRADRAAAPPRCCRRQAHADLAALLEEAARKEGTLTWYIAQVDGETAEVMGRAFTSTLSRHVGLGDPHHWSGRISSA